MSIRVVKLLYLQLYVTLFLDGVNEIATHFGFPMPLGQVVRGMFLVVDMLVVFSLGKRRDVQIMILCIVFFVLESLREAYLGSSGIIASGVYWSKVVSCILVFMAIKAAYQSGLLDKGRMDSFFKLSIIIIPLFFLVLTYTGLMSLDQIDAGIHGSILSKNALTAVLLILFTMSLKFGFEKPASLAWSMVVMLCLMLLGSKAAIVFVVLILVASMLHQMRAQGAKRLLPFLLISVGIIAVVFVFGDRINEVVLSQLGRLHYVTAVQDQSLTAYLLTGRNNLAEAGFATFASGFTPYSLLVGNGFSSIVHGVANIVQSGGDARGIEMDMIEIFLSAGLIGLCFVLYPVVKAIQVGCAHGSKDRFYFFIGLFVVLVFSFLAGHVYTEGMSAEYFGIFLAYFIVGLPNDEVPEGEVSP